MAAAGATKPREAAAALAEEEVGTLGALLKFSDANVAALLKDCGVKAGSVNSIREYCAAFRTGGGGNTPTASAAARPGDTDSPPGRGSEERAHARPPRPPTPEFD